MEEIQFMSEEDFTDQLHKVRSLLDGWYCTNFGKKQIRRYFFRYIRTKLGDTLFTGNQVVEMTQALFDMLDYMEAREGLTIGKLRESDPDYRQ